MKKLLIAIGLSLSMGALGQTVEQRLGAPYINSHFLGYIGSDSGAYLAYRDTTFTPGKINCIVVRPGDGLAYLWNGTTWGLLGAPVWGKIRGSLANQTDLMDSLNNRQGILIAGYGIRLSHDSIDIDSAHVPLVHSVYRLSDSTIGVVINGTIDTILLRGTAAGGISSLADTVPSILFASPVVYTNTGGAWRGKMQLQLQNPNTFFAGDSLGTSDTPRFRHLALADLPVAIPNSNLANSGITFLIDNVGSSPAWSNSGSVPLGSSIILHLPMASATSSGIISASDWARFNSTTVPPVTSVNGQIGAVSVGSADSLRGYPIDFTNFRDGWVLVGDSTNGKLEFISPGSSTFDSLTSQGGVFHTGLYNDTRYFKRTDSSFSSPSNAVTQGSRQKLSDSLAAVIALKLSKYDTSAGPPEAYVTWASRQKLADSLSITVQTKQTDLIWLPITYYGAKPDSSTDATAAIQACIDSISRSLHKKGVIWIPPGVFWISGTIHVPQGTQISWRGGAGSRGEVTNAVSKWIGSRTTGYMLQDSADNPDLRDFDIVNMAASPTSGANVLFTGRMVSMTNMIISGGYDNVVEQQCLYSRYQNVFFLEAVRYDVNLSNNANPDEGDPRFLTCVFQSGTATPQHATQAAIYQTNSGGIEILGCKANGSGTGIVDFYRGHFVGSGNSTSDLLINGNSIENFSGHAIRIDVPTSANFGHIEITGNQIASWASAGHGILLDGTGGGLHNIAIAGNIITSLDTAIQAYHIDHLKISANDIDSGGVNNSVSYKFVESSCTNCVFDDWNTGGGGGLLAIHAKNPSVHIYSGDSVAIPFRIWNVIDFGADSTGHTDATSAIQNAILAVAAAGGGTVYAPAGTYKIAGPLVTSLPTGSTPNCQIYIPNTGLRTANAITINIMGDRPPSFEKSIVTSGYVPNLQGYTVFLSTITNTTGQPAFVIGTDDSLFSGQRWNATEVSMSNLIVRTTSTTGAGADTVGTMSGINFGTVTATGDFENVVVDNTSFSPVSSVKPAIYTYGIIFSNVNNSAWNPVRNVMVAGYGTGIVANEHFNADQLFVSNCDTAISVTNTNHSIKIGKLTLNGVRHGLVAHGTTYITIQNFDTEHMNSACRSGAWFQYQDDIMTYNTYGLRGTIEYHCVISCGADQPDSFRVVNLAANLEPPYLAYSDISQSPLPWHTIIGNGDQTTNGSFNEPNSAGLTIASRRGDNPELVMMYNSDTTTEYAGQGIINAKTNNATWQSIMSRYVSPGQGQFVESMWNANTSSLQTVLTRNPFQFQLGTYLIPASWSTSTRPSTGVTQGCSGFNTDSLWWECYDGSAWHQMGKGASSGGGGYTLPISTSSVLGGVTVPASSTSGLSINGTTGALSVAANWDYVLANQGSTNMSVSHTINGGGKALYLTGFDSLELNATYFYDLQPFNINAGSPTINFNNGAGTTNYASVKANGSGSIAWTAAGGGFFHSWLIGSTEYMRLNPSGNLLLGNFSDSLAFLQIAPATTLKAQLFFHPSAVDPNSSNIKNGMLWYDSLAGAFNFRHNNTTYNLLSGGGSTTLQQAITNGATLTGNNTITNTGHDLTFGLGGTGTIKYTGMNEDTTNTAGLYAAANDSSQRMLPWAKLALKLGDYLPPTNIYAANGLTAAAGDSFYFGGTLNQNTTIAQAGYTLSVTGGNIGMGTAATTSSALTTGISNYNSSYGTGFVTTGGTSNDPITAASGTVTTMAANRFKVPTFTASNTGVTYTNSATVYIDGAPTAGTNVTQTNPYALYVNGAGYFAGTSTHEQIQGIYNSGTAAPSLAFGTGAGGGGASGLLTGTDLNGRISVTPGGTIVGSNATILTVTFHSASFPNGCIVTLTPANAATAALSGTTGTYVTETGTSFSIVSGTVALTAATNYIWNYQVMGF